MTTIIENSVKFIIDNIEHTSEINENKMVNATEICKATKKKEFYNYRKLKGTQSELDKYENKDTLIISVNNNAWVHLCLLKHFIKWVSKDIYVQLENFLNNIEINITKSNNSKQINIPKIELILKDKTKVSISRNKNKFINVTEICRYTNNHLGYWKRNKKNLELIKKDLDIFEEDMYGTHAKPEIAISIAEWCSKNLGKQIQKILEKEEKNGIEESEKKEKIQNNSNNIVNFTLKLKDNLDFIVPVRKDGYINATELCKAGGKRIDNYKQNKQTQEYLQALISITGIPGIELIKTNIGGDHTGTWVHRKVAIHLAQWISPTFSVQVSNWLDELLLTGKVELGKEKNYEELENIYKIRIQKLEYDNEITNKNLEQFKLTNQVIVKENSLLKKHVVQISKVHDEMCKKRNYHKFKKGYCFYIVKDDWREKDYFKFGITSNINDRLQDYRTIVPECKILFLVYLENNKVLEDCIKNKYKDILTHKNHEYIISIDINELIINIKQLLKFLNIDNTIEDKLELYNNPYDTSNIKLKENNNDVVSEEGYKNIKEYDEENIDDDCKNIEDHENIKEYVNEELVNVDEIEKIDSPYKFVCETCNKAYKTEIFLSKHMKTEHNIILEIVDKYSKHTDKTNNKKCITCDKIYSTISKLKRHIDVIHNNSQKINCDYCNLELASKDSLRTHVKLVHEKANVVSCKVCNKIFSSNGSLASHIKNIHEKLSIGKCDKCHKIFSTKQSLKNHILRIHENISDKVTCELCDKSVDKKNYDYHKYSIHKIK